MKQSRRYHVVLWEENRIQGWLWVVFFIILGIGLSLNSYLLLFQSVRLDEAQSLWASTKPVTAIIDFISQDVSVPLYALLLHFWIQLFGPNIVYARLLSLIFFLLTLPVLYLLASHASNRKVAMVTVLLFSLSPFTLWYSTEARMYTLFTLISSLNYLFFFHMLTSKGEKGKAGYFMSTVLGLYTHYFFTVLLATQVLYIVFRWIQDAYKGQEASFTLALWQHRDFPFRVFTLIGGAGLFFVPWVVGVITKGTIVNTEPLIPPPTSFNLFALFTHFLFGFQASDVQSVIISLWPVVIVVLFLIFTQKRRTKILQIDYLVFATFVPIALVFVGSYFRPIFLSRYLILVTPTLFLLLAWLLINNSRKMTSVLVSGIILAMFILMVYQNVSASTPVKEDYRGVSAYLQQYATPQDIIVVSAPFTVYPIEYTYGGTTRIDTIPSWDRYNYGAIPPFSQQVLTQQIKRYTTRYNRLFVVLSYDQGYEKTIKNYLDTHYKRNQLQTFSPGLEIRVYQLRYN